MKDFMLIFTGVNYAEKNLSPEEIQARAASWMGWQAKMGGQGIMKEGNALHGELKRISGPDRTVSDRSAAESKEIIGGYYIVTASDVEAAMAIAQDYPDYDLGGSVEVREVMHYDQ